MTLTQSCFGYFYVAHNANAKRNVIEFVPDWQVNLSDIIIDL